MHCECMMAVILFCLYELWGNARRFWDVRGVNLSNCGFSRSLKCSIVVSKPRTSWLLPVVFPRTNILWEVAHQFQKHTVALSREPIVAISNTRKPHRWRPVKTRCALPLTSFVCLWTLEDRRLVDKHYITIDVAVAWRRGLLQSMRFVPNFDSVIAKVNLSLWCAQSNANTIGKACAVKWPSMLQTQTWKWAMDLFLCARLTRWKSFDDDVVIIITSNTSKRKTALCSLLFSTFTRSILIFFSSKDF